MVFGLVIGNIQSNLPDPEDIKNERIFSIDSGFVLDEKNPIKLMNAGEFWVKRLYQL